MSLYNNNTNPLPRSRTTEEYVKYLGIGSLPEFEKNERLLDLQDKIVEPNAGNFIPELSPDYNPSTGRLSLTVISLLEWLVMTRPMQV